MLLLEKKMYIIRRKNTEEYMRNNGYFRSLEDEGKSAIKLYETINNAKTAVRYNLDGYDILPVTVSINLCPYVKNTRDFSHGMN